MMKTKILNRLTTLLLLLPVYSSAQIMIPNALKQAIRAACEKSAILNNQALESQKTENEIEAVKGKYLPDISIKAGYAYLSNHLTLDLPAITLPLTGSELLEGTTTLHNQAHLAGGGITARQVIFSGGQILNGARALRKKKEGDDYSNELTKDEIIKEVIGSFDQIRLLDKAGQLITESEKRLEREHERVERAIKEGLAIPYDRDKIKLAQLSLAAQRESVTAKRALLFQKIKFMTGYDEEQIAIVQYDLETIAVPQDPDTKSRNELKALEAYEEAINFNIKKEKGSLLPAVGAFAHLGYGGLYHGNIKFPLPVSGNEAQLKLNKAALQPSWILGVALSWDIFNGGQKKKAIENLKIDQQILQNKKSEAEEKMDLQLQNNKTRNNTLLNQLAISEQKEKIAKNNLFSAEKQYQLGLISVTERLTAETDLYAASLQKTKVLTRQRQAALDVYAASKTLENFIH